MLTAYGKPRDKVIQGRYAGEYLTSDRGGKHWAIKDLPICCENVKFFKVIRPISMYYCEMTGYLCGIKWRDGTESFFITDRAVVDMMSKSLLKERKEHLGY